MFEQKGNLFVALNKEQEQSLGIMEKK